MKMKPQKEILEELFPPSDKCRWCDAEPAREDGYCSDYFKSKTAELKQEVPSEDEFWLRQIYRAYYDL